MNPYLCVICHVGRTQNLVIYSVLTAFGIGGVVILALLRPAKSETDKKGENDKKDENDEKNEKDEIYDVS